MQNRWKKLILAFSLLFAFSILVEAYCCEDYSSPQASAHCCVQCCPSHHLVPPIKAFGSLVEAPSREFFAVPHLEAPALMLPFSIFHPPKTSLI